MNTEETKQTLPEELITDKILEEMLYYLYSKGIVMKNKDFSGVTHAPICVFPSPTIKPFFNKIDFYQIAFNKLIDKMSHDTEFLLKVLKPFAENDIFIKRYLDILELSEANKNKQTYHLGIFRNDFMVDKIKKFIYQIEINTCASSMGFFSDSLREFHKHFVQKYPELYRKYHFLETINGEKVYSYKVPFEKPEVIPNIAEAMDQALTIYINNLNSSNNLLNAINSNLTSKFFSKKSVCVLFIVQDKERNIFDQRAIEMKLYENYNINTVRLTLQEVFKSGKLDASNGELSIDDKIVGLVYFRAGYDEKDFPNEDCWKAREMIELSNAIKCPNVNQFLCTFKIFQNELNKKEVLAKFIPEELIANDISRFFTKIYNVTEMTKESQIELFKAIRDSPGNYVVKPQKEGGSHNYYNEEMIKLLPQNVDEENFRIDPILQGSIIMDRIHPPTFESLIIRENKLVKSECISEVSVYGIILSSNDNYLINKSAGFLVRTKAHTTDEGGVATGYSALDIPYLIDLNGDNQEITFK